MIRVLEPQIAKNEDDFYRLDQLVLRMLELQSRLQEIDFEAAQRWKRLGVGRVIHSNEGNGIQWRRRGVGARRR